MLVIVPLDVYSETTTQTDLCCQLQAWRGYMNNSVSEITGVLFNGGYFPPFIRELFSKIVSSLIVSFSSPLFNDSARLIRDSQAALHRAL
jgi:hypothetical protein